MIEKFETGIVGFDEITDGGLPINRTTLVAGGAGCGKTLFLLTAMANGVLAKGNPAVFFSLEELPNDAISNAESIGLNLQHYIDGGLLVVDHVRATNHQTIEVGEYSLEGLKLRIDLALKASGAKFLIIDTIETLFTMFKDERTVRLEFIKLLQWLSSEDITCIVSGEKGDGRLTRRGLEEYVSDCVISLENETTADVATRRLRVVKYRGSQHGMNLYPFLIDDKGITVMPLSSALLNHTVSGKRLATGTKVLNDALDGGIRVGSTTLISGGTGTGKTIISSLMAEAACDRAETVIYISFEESPAELIWNVGAAGIDFTRHVLSKKLAIHSARPTSYGLERHLVELYRLVEINQPTMVVIDPVSSLSTAGSDSEVYRTTVRMIDFLKSRKITSILTMEGQNENLKYAEVNFSSILDVWLHIDADASDNRNGIERYIRIMKARGINHDHRNIPFQINTGSVNLESPDE